MARTQGLPELVEFSSSFRHVDDSSLLSSRDGRSRAVCAAVCAKFGELRASSAHCDAARNCSPSYIVKLPNAASHSRIAFSSIASNTGARSPGDELITCSTSAVAVCCSNASRVSVRAERSPSRSPPERRSSDQPDLPLGERPDLLAKMQ